MLGLPIESRERSVNEATPNRAPRRHALPRRRLREDPPRELRGSGRFADFRKAIEGASTTSRRR